MIIIYCKTMMNQSPKSVESAYDGTVDCPLAEAVENVKSATTTLSLLKTQINNMFIFNSMRKNSCKHTHTHPHRPPAYNLLIRNMLVNAPFPVRL